MSDYDGGDVFGVTRTATGYQVTHYPTATTRRACCRVTVNVTPKDIELGKPLDDPFGYVQALARANRHIEKKHGR